MATVKPTKPSITLPTAFGTSPSNVKTPFTAQELVDGFSASIPQVLDGGNLNFIIDALFQFLTWSNKYADWFASGSANTVPYVNSSNQLDYATPVFGGSNNTFTGNNTFSNTITGSITGNAGTVTNGVYTNTDQTITGNKTFSGAVSLNGSLNAGTSAKETIIGYGEPDYSTAVSVSLPFTATYKGWLLGYASRSGGNSTLYVNNVVVSREDADYANVQMLLDVGDEVTYTHPTSSGIELVFAKCKGV